MEPARSGGAGQWTAQCVAERLVWAFALLPHHAVFATTGPLALMGLGGAADVLDWPSRFVVDPYERRLLMTWARCRASGGSVRALYRDLGWCRAKAERHRRDALAMIALGLNESLTMRPPAEEP